MSPDQVLQAPFDALPDAETLIRAAMRWHFDPSTGSPFWLRTAESLGFDPVSDVRTVADLRLFPDVSGRLRDVAVEELVPRGFGDAVPRVFESGGTTGSPKRIVELGFWRRTAHWIDRCLDCHGVPRGGNWLYLGPTGPHVVGYTFGIVAGLRGSPLFTVDFDPRWVKRAAGELSDYLDHIVDQAAWLLRSQRITVLWATPPMLVALADRPNLVDVIGSTVDSVVWSGVSASAETLHLLGTEVFPRARFVGVYGNTMMGAAVQRPGDDDCVFEPFYPHSIVEVVDPDTGASVGYGERGRVRLHHITQDLLLPNMMERDLAVRRRPGRIGGPDGLSDVVSVAPRAQAFVEGVY